MKSLIEQLANLVADAFASINLDRKYGKIILSNRPDLCQFQCNGALAAAKAHKLNPHYIGQQISDIIIHSQILDKVSVEGAGFINLTVKDEFLKDVVSKMGEDKNLGVNRSVKPKKIIIDYGGANIAKPLHVGHLRSAIIGECLKRLARFIGHEVISDIHLGDWGLQMGMIISELERLSPDLPYFNPAYNGPYPTEPPVNIADLEEIYPAVSARAKEDPAITEKARIATFELQNGRAGYKALWKHIYNISVSDLRSDYSKLGIEFDLWLGESDTQDRIQPLIERLKSEGYAYSSEGALVIDITETGKGPLKPPLILQKSDGAILYGTTDLATIEQRVTEFNPDLIIYVVDGRQKDHFYQVFRGAQKSGIAPESLELEHIGFGTMNGKDGKPFKTRQGGVMKLKDLIQMITEKALERMAEAGIAKSYSEAERTDIARRIGVAMLKYADLMNHYSINYIFDLDRFASFEGNTGPYLLYAAVRIKSILRNAKEKGIISGILMTPVSLSERSLFLKISELPETISLAYEKRSPNILCDYVYNLAAEFSKFYHDHHILGEKDSTRQASRLTLCEITLSVLELVLDLLGIEVPERM